MFSNIKQKILKYWYKKSKNIYIVGCWARWGVLPAKFSGIIDKDGDPLTIYFNDHNGMKETYNLHKWYHETTGVVLAYFFNEKEAEGRAKIMNKKEGL